MKGYLKRLMWLFATKGSGGGSGGTAATVTGTPPLTLPDALAKAIRSLTQYGKTTQSTTPTPSSPVDIVCNNGVLKTRHESGLPSGYTLLDKVYNNTNTIVNTGILDDVDDLRIELQVKPTTGSWYIAQSRASSSGPIYGISGSGTGNTILFNNGSTSSLSSGIARDSSHTYTVIGEHKNGVISLYVKDETTGAEDTKTGTYATADFTAATTRIGIWSNGVNNAASGNEVYHLRIYKSGVLVADYVPCQYNNENGFYDFVSGSFKGATNGSINAGTAVTDPVEVFVDGTPEVLSVGGRTASVQSLLAVGNYADEQNIISGAVKRNVGVRVFNGTENDWTLSDSGTTHRFRGTKPSNCYTPTSRAPIVSTHFKYVSTGSATGGAFIGASSYWYFVPTDQTIETVEQWKSWLAAQFAAGTPVIVVYPLAEEATETVEPQHLNTTAGTNTVSVTAEVQGIELEVTYMKSGGN